MSTTVERSVEIEATPEEVFDLIHDYPRRLEWDPFLREALLLDGAERAGVGVANRCTARWSAGGRAMVTRYVSFERPDVAAVKMTRGPWFLKSFAASIRQRTVAPGRTRVTYRYNFEARPRLARGILEAVFRRVFSRETQRRLEGLKCYLETSPGGRGSGATPSR